MHVPVTTSAEETLKARLKGEAYFLRAYEYAMLLMNYGGVVLMDKPNTLDQDFQTMTQVNNSSDERFCSCRYRKRYYSSDRQVY